MSKKYKSGYQKRKLKLENDEKISKLRKIDSIFAKSENEKKDESSGSDKSEKKDENFNNFVIIETTEIESALNKDSVISNDGDLAITENDKNTCASKNKTSEKIVVSGGNGGTCVTESHKNTSVSEDGTNDNRMSEINSVMLPDDGIDLDTDKCDEFSVITNTDIGLFPGNLDIETKRKIICSKPCRPLGPFPKDTASNRSFSTEYYSVVTKTGQKLERTWLCYSEIKNSVYCEPCWLFSDRADPNFKGKWCDGTINDWQGLSKKIKKHENSVIHLNACEVYSRWKKNKIDFHFKVDIEKWRKILTRIIDVILTLSMCNLAFRGHREDIQESDNCGNFLSIVKLLAKYDPVLQSHISNEKIRNKYFSATIQNEIISLLSKSVRKSILDEVREAPFFSIIVDTTQDITKRDQLSLIFRYVKINANKNIEIIEAFIGFFEVKNQSGKDLEMLIVDTLKSDSIDIKKCRGQGYDGAANMKGKYNGLQAQIRKLSKNADYVHCAAHNLNLVLNDAVKNITVLVNFYDLIQSIYVFFSESLPRWQNLNDAIDEVGRKKAAVTLKKLNPTRWSSRFDSLQAIRSNFLAVMNCLSVLSISLKKNEDRNQASALRNKMSCFEFVLLLIFQDRVLHSTNLASKILQLPSMDLALASQILETAKRNLESLRSNFSDVAKEAEELAKVWKIETNFKNRRVRRVKKFYDELAVDENIKDPLKNFEIFVFNASLDILVCQLKERFQSMKIMHDYFSFLCPDNLLKLSDEEIRINAENLCNKYEDDLSGDFPQQLLNLRTTLSDDIKKARTVKDLAKLVMVEKPCIASCVPDVCTALLLFLTLPVTSASAERAFSKLKLIKTYLRNSMSQNRLSDLGILSIEHEKSKNINIDEVINEFLSLKRRRFKKM